MEKNIENKLNENNNGYTQESVISPAELQTYYSEAYINERERLNSMFGRLDTYPIVEKEIVYRDPDYTNYVPIKKYKKKCAAATVLGILFAIATLGAGFLAYLYFFAN